MHKVLVSARAFRRGGEEAFAPLRAFGAEPVTIPELRMPTREELLELIPDVDAVVAGNEAYTEEVFAAAPRLKVIARWGIGYDAIDLEAATRHGVVVANTPGLITDSVADFTFGLMIALARKLVEADRSVRSGEWREIEGVHVWQKCLGIIGFGHIGRAVARRAQGFGMDVLAYDVRPDEAAAQALGVRFVPLHELLERADFVSLHAALTEESRGMIGAAELARLKPTAYLINTARGALVDEQALLTALQQGRLAGAAIDAHWQEPPPPDHLLFTLDNVIVTPHIAFNTRETLQLVNRAVAENILAVWQGRRPRSVVNPAVYEK